MAERTGLQAEILGFIRSSNVATICCSDGSSVHAFCCFYAFDSNGIQLIFKSKADARHCHILSQNPCVSGTIISSGASILNNKGIQFEGLVIPRSASAEHRYYLKYFFAIGVEGDLYTIRIDQIKYTSSTSGKRLKLAWARNNE